MQATTKSLVTVQSEAATTATGLERLRSLLAAAKQVETQLHDQRERAYRRGDAVFDRTVPSETTAWIEGDVELPAPTVDMLVERNAYKWLVTYTAVLYNDTGWHHALTQRPEKYRYQAQELVIPQQLLSAPTEQVLAISLGEASIPLQLTKATADEFRAAESVRLSLVPTDHPAVHSGAVAGESPTLWVETTPAIIRVAAETPGPDGRVSRRHVNQLDQCHAPFEDAWSMGIVGDVLATGYYTPQDEINWVALLSGTRDVVAISFRPVVAFITERLIALFNLETEPVPQTGTLLLSVDRSALPGLTLASTFPDRQQLTPAEQRQIGRVLGYPRVAIESHLTRSFPDIQATERLGQLYAAGAVSRPEIDAYQFADYDPCPTETGIYRRIRDGRELQNALTTFDTEHDTSIHEYVTAGTTFEHLHII
jgi:hypothetical protein